MCGGDVITVRLLACKVEEYKICMVFEIVMDKCLVQFWSLSGASLFDIYRCMDIHCTDHCYFKLRFTPGLPVVLYIYAI